MSISHDVFSESAMEESPDQTSKTNTNRDKRDTQVSSEAQNSDTNPCEQSSCQSTKGMY